MISTEQLVKVFIETADTLVADFDAIDFLHELTEHAATISGADAVGLMLADRLGRLQFLAASNETGKVLELLQLQAQEGPCIDCYNTAEPVVNADLSTAEERWPQFAPAARAAGFLSVHAFPMRLRDNVIGALNIFGHGETIFADDDTRVVQALADIATIAILQEQSITRAEALSEQLQGALRSRIVIEQAKGALAQLTGTSPTDAFRLLRAQARRSERRLTEVAADVLAQIGDDPGAAPAKR